MPKNSTYQPDVKEQEFLAENEIKTIITYEFESTTPTLIHDLLFTCYKAFSSLGMKELTTDILFIFLQMTLIWERSTNGKRCFYQIFSRYPFGEHPSIFLNIRVKCCGY